MKYDREEIVWIADGIKAILLAHNGTEKFPEDLYNKIKNIVGWQREYSVNE